MTDKAVEEYIDALPEDRQKIIRVVHNVIRKAVPHLELHRWNEGIGYGTSSYKYASGREGDWFPIGLASQKNYISLYFYAIEGNKYLAEAHEERLGRVDVGRSCVRFKKLENLNLDVVAELCAKAEKLTPNGHKAA